MRILADENCPGDLVLALREQGHDIVWCREDSPGSSDSEILARAQREKRLVLTFDKDFGELAFKYRLPAQAGIILCRLHGVSPSRVVDLVLRALVSQPAWTGAFAVISEERIRVIPLAL